METDDHFCTLLRYVERNALRANLAEAAELWRWGSLWRRVDNVRTGLLTDCPLSEPRKWVPVVHQPQTEVEVEAIRRCILRGCPYEKDEWVQRTAEPLDLRSTLRPRGRPKLAESR